MGLAIHQFGQARIGLGGNQARPVFGQPFDMLGHFLRAGGAVQADQVGFQRVNDRGCRRNVRPDQQRAGGFHRNLHKNGQCCSGFGAGALDAVDSGLDLQRVLTGFDQDRIHPAFDQPRVCSVRASSSVS